jgi:hypothetical protein
MLVAIIPDQNNNRTSEAGKYHKLPLMEWIRKHAKHKGPSKSILKKMRNKGEKSEKIARKGRRMQHKQRKSYNNPREGMGPV